MAPALQDAEQMSSQVLTIVGENGKQSIRREWERVQFKSHEINTTILKVKTNIFYFIFCLVYLDRTTITKLYYRLFNIF